MGVIRIYTSAVHTFENYQTLSLMIAMLRSRELRDAITMAHH